jgi:hypothetical protein
VIFPESCHRTGLAVNHKFPVLVAPKLGEGGSILARK